MSHECNQCHEKNSNDEYYGRDKINIRFKNTNLCDVHKRENNLIRTSEANQLVDVDEDQRNMLC